MTTSSNSTWSGRPVLVTGAAGFIGSHLVEYLTGCDAAVRAFVRYNSRNDLGWLETLDPDVTGRVEIFRGDLTNSEAVMDAVQGREVVFHLGALIPIPYSYRHPREFVDTNVVGALNMLEACRRTGVGNLVHVSSSEVYGTPKVAPIPETAPLNAQSPYAATKVGADQLVMSYRASFGLPAVIARPFNTYGPRQSARAVIPTIIMQALAKRTIELGSTSTTRDFMFVADTVRGLVRCGEPDLAVEHEIFNLGTGREASIAEVIELVSAILGRELPVAASEERLRPAGSEVERLLADASRAASELRWAAEVTLEDGLRRTIDWFADNLGLYKPSLYHV
jgi:NAD dependent epimerase/dehydratase